VPKPPWFPGESGCEPGRPPASHGLDRRELGAHPGELIAHQLAGAARCDGAARLIAYASQAEWTLDAEHIECPVRVVWGTADKLLPWPSAAVRYRREWLPTADWVELESVGHCPQLDVPLETAELILGLIATANRASG
jgi:pimeloyl-ACP methyl ester carboxylesterase